jgi:hypothetical protein
MAREALMRPGSGPWTLLALVAVGCRAPAGAGGDVVDAAEPDARGEVERFIDERWLAAQREGDEEAYAALLAEGFVGTVLMSTGEEATLPREAWIRHRAKALASRPAIGISGLEVEQGPDGLTATFEQSWETAQYCDVGSKSLVLVRSGADLLVSSERMLSVSECPWACAGSFFTFATRYVKAWRGGDAGYVAEHTCLPLVVGGGTEGERRIEAPPDLLADGPIRDLMRVVTVRPEPTRARLGQDGCELEVSAETSGQVALVDVEPLSCPVETAASLEFTFSGKLWKLCSVSGTLPAIP